MPEPPSDCVCGHPRSEHHGEPGRGPCMASTPTETWACDCSEWRPAIGPSDRSPVGEYSGLAAEHFLQHTEPGSSPWGTRDDLRRYALDAQRQHTPANQPDNGYDRCALCHYTRHPCDVYDLASAVLWLLDEGRTDA